MASVNNITTEILLDTGAETSAISERFISKHSKHFKNTATFPVNNTSINTATNGKESVKKQMLININLDGNNIDIPMLVVPNLVANVLLGIDQLTYLQANLNLKENSMSYCISNKNYNVKFKNKHSQIGDEQRRTQPVTIERPAIKIKRSHEINGQDNVLLNTEQQDVLENLMYKHNEVFSDKPKLANVYIHRIEVTDETKFVRRTYLIPIHHQRKVELEIKQMLDNGVIERSTSNFLNPVVKKLNNDIRLCLDMRNLNSFTVKSYDCAPNVDDLFRKCRGIKYMTRLDLTSSFLQIPLDENSRKYTAFLYNNRCYQFKVVSFGHVTSLAAIVKCLEMAFGPDVESFVSGFVDDILVVSKTFKEHIEHLDIVFRN